MALEYTTLEKLASKLSPRVKVGSTEHYGTSCISFDDLEYIALQQESLLNSKLHGIYELPLKTEHLILGSFVEQATICEVLGQFYTGEDISNDSNASSIFCTNSKQLLKQICNKEITLIGEDFLLQKKVNPSGFNAVTTRNVTRSDAAENISFF